MNIITLTQQIQTQIVDSFKYLKQQIKNRQLYVLYETQLNCNPSTDHEKPKDVLPLFKTFIDQIEVDLEEKIQTLLQQLEFSTITQNDYQKLQNKSALQENIIAKYEFANLRSLQLKLSGQNGDNQKLLIQNLYEQLNQKKKENSLYKPNDGVGFSSSDDFILQYTNLMAENEVMQNYIVELEGQIKGLQAGLKKDGLSIGLGQKEELLVNSVVGQIVVKEDEIDKQKRIIVIENSLNQDDLEQTSSKNVGKSKKSGHNINKMLKTNQTQENTDSFNINLHNPLLKITSRQNQIRNVEQLFDIDQSNPNNMNGQSNPNNMNGQSNPNNMNGSSNPNNMNGQSNPNNMNGQSNPNNMNGQSNPNNMNGQSNPNNMNGQSNPNNMNGQSNPNNMNGSSNPNNMNGQSNPNNMNGQSNPNNMNGQSNPNNMNGQSNPNNMNGQSNPNNMNGQSNPNNMNGQSNPNNMNGQSNPNNMNGQSNPNNMNGQSNPNNMNGQSNPNNMNGQSNPNNMNGQSNPNNMNGSSNPNNMNGQSNPNNMNGSSNPNKNGQINNQKDTDITNDLRMVNSVAQEYLIQQQYKKKLTSSPQQFQKKIYNELQIKDLQLSESKEQLNLIHNYSPNSQEQIVELYQRSVKLCSKSTQTDEIQKQLAVQYGLNQSLFQRRSSLSELDFIKNQKHLKGKLKSTGPQIEGNMDNFVLTSAPSINMLNKK